MSLLGRIPTLTPIRVAGGYLLFGFIWIVSTDRLATNITQSTAELTFLQTVKGWIFVFASAAVLFGLAYSRERQIDAEREFTELAINSLNDVFVVLDNNGAIKQVNERAATVTGYPKQELIGMAPTELIVPDDRNAVESAIEDVFESKTARVEATLVTRRESRILYEFRGRLMQDDQGNLKGVAVIGRDITERVLSEQQLEVAQRALRHNLKNKANLILGRAEEIADESAYAEVRDSIIASINELLDMSDQARKMSVLTVSNFKKSRQIDLKENLSSILGEFQEQYPETTIESDLSIDGTMLDSWEYLLETAVINIVENAIEHNESDNPWVLVESNVEPASARIVIHDNGPGIPDHEVAVQREEAETVLEHSSGMGLWLANWCVDMLRGEMSIEPRSPTGSTVTLVLPTKQETR